MINNNDEFKRIMKKVESVMSMSDEKIDEVVDNIRNIVKKYVKDSNLKCLVVGISGGLDSAVIAAILQEKYIGVPLIGISIPMSSSNEHREQAEWVGNTFCSEFEEFNDWDKKIKIAEENKEIYNMIFETMVNTDRLMERAGFDTSKFPTNILQGNMKARVRMMTLYDMANKGQGMVLSTDNYSEYLAGFWTINGDVGDYGPIQNIWKGFELPQIARKIGVREDIITQKPSDGLMVTEDNTDEAQLGMTYQEFDTIMSIYTKKLDVDDETFNELSNSMENIDKNSIDGIKISKAIKRFENSKFKRTGTINLTREEINI